MRALFFFVIFLMVDIHVVFANGTCYCGAYSPYDPDNGGEEYCKRVCHYQSPSTTSSSSSGSSGGYSGISQPFYNLGYGIGQALMGNPQEHRNRALALNDQGIQYSNNQQWQEAANAFEEALQESDDPVIRQNLERVRQVLAQQAAQREKERQEAIARKKQEMYDHLSSVLKTSGDGKTVSLGLNDLKNEDGDSGHAGIKGLPGIYLNDNSGNGSNTPYGISGLPGTYVNGPSSGDQGGLQLMKDDDNPPPASSAVNTGNAPVNKNSIPFSGAPSGMEPAGAGGLQLMKDDDNTPQPQTATAPVMASLQQQADASQAAAGASSPEDASAKAREGFDTALHSDNSAPVLLGPGAHNATAPVPASSQQQTGVSQRMAEASSPQDAAAQVRGRAYPSGVVDPAIVNGSSPSLTTDADKALMKHQWEMSIDPRYLSDPAVQQNIRDLWAAARSRDYAADDKLKTILADQFKASGQTPQQIADFFTKFNAIATGEGSGPKEWSEVSSLANAMDVGLGSFVPPEVPAYVLTGPKYYSQKVADIGLAESITAPGISYKGSGKQAEDDCVLYAIANGSGVKVEQVKDELNAVVNKLGMDSTGERANPQIVVASLQQGGRGGVSAVEELLVAEKFGKVIPVPTDSYARAIASTGRPVITTVDLNPPNGTQHKVVVTGVHRAKDGKIYYSVMDSNLGNDYHNSTDYVEKSFFEDHLASGGFVVMPKDHK